MSEPKADAPSSSLPAALLWRVGSLLDGHISLRVRVRGGGALFATDLSAFLSSPPILSLDILSLANKDFVSELSSLQRHDQHPVRQLVAVQNAKVNSYVFKFILLTA